ncbi:Bowman-Birk type trypsin inhibitor TI1 [Triticum urartu]|uniref:Bowman-Birk type trypsin inhibitor TI1 n=1 Tax=Triticum urartu TaxID=4572 RepID=M7YWI1_TRIUA|nr:Bowman-Birk type trypsin inhibitor TI1 [Triticum urartu]
MTGRAAAILVLMLSLPAAALLVVAADGASPATAATVMHQDPTNFKFLLRSSFSVRAECVRRWFRSCDERGRRGAPPDKVMEAEKPWACCSSTVCKESLPPVCRCLDKVKECAAACKLCEPSGVSHVVCNDWYRGDPGPMCA